MSNVRFDSSRFSKTKTTDDGYLETNAIVTRTGVFLYQNSDGSTRRELRHPDDVFTQDSLETLKMIPLTDSHPEEKLVTSKSAKKLQVGYVGQDIRVDGKYIRAPLVVTDDESITKVKSGKNKLSLGYTADTIKEDGEYNGQRYDSRQTNIKYNHLALCSNPRAGNMASIMLDSGDATMLDEEVRSDVVSDLIVVDENRSKTMVKITLDGIGYEASAEVSNAFDKANMRADELTAELESKKGIMDAMEAENGRLKAEVEAFDVKFNDSVNCAVTARVKLVAESKNILDSKTDISSMTNQDIKQAVISAISPAAILDGVSDEYISARFDAALEMHAMRKPVSEQHKAVNDATGSVKQETGLQASRAAYLTRLTRGDK